MFYFDQLNDDKKSEDRVCIIPTLVDLQLETLQLFSKGERIVHAENLHTTLKFIPQQFEAPLSAECAIPSSRYASQFTMPLPLSGLQEDIEGLRYSVRRQIHFFVIDVHGQGA